MHVQDNRQSWKRSSAGSSRDSLPLIGAIGASDTGQMVYECVHLCMYLCVCVCMYYIYAHIHEYK